MLDVINVSKDYFSGVKTSVLDDISFSVNEGDFVIVTGKSGSGKSTLLYIISGLENPTSGSILFDGRNIHGLNDKELSKLRRNSFGFVFQFYNLISSISVYDNICLPLSLDHKLSEEEKERIKKIADILGIEELLDRYPYQLSGGQQQRVAIARALVIDPEIIFADEPTGNLDDETSNSIMELFDELNSKYGKTIVMVTHDNDISTNYGNVHITVSKHKALISKAGM